MRRSPLTYIRGRWLHARGVVLSAGAVALAAAAWSPATPASRAESWRDLCLGYTAPAERVIYEEDFERALPMTVFPEDEEGGHSGCSPAYDYVAVFKSSKLIELGFSQDAGIVFLHTRRAPGQERRLVVVQLTDARDKFINKGSRQSVPLYYTVLTGSGRVKRLKTGVWPLEGTPVNWRLYAGQFDAADAAHFTIRYACNGVPGVIDAWLQADDTLRFVVRDGPAAEK